MSNGSSSRNSRSGSNGGSGTNRGSAGNFRTDFVVPFALRRAYPHKQTPQCPCDSLFSKSRVVDALWSVGIGVKVAVVLVICVVLILVLVIC